MHHRSRSSSSSTTTFPPRGASSLSRFVIMRRLCWTTATILLLLVVKSAEARPWWASGRSSLPGSTILNTPSTPYSSLLLSPFGHSSTKGLNTKHRRSWCHPLSSPLVHARDGSSSFSSTPETGVAGGTSLTCSGGTCSYSNEGGVDHDASSSTTTTTNSTHRSVGRGGATRTTPQQQSSEPQHGTTQQLDVLSSGGVAEQQNQQQQQQLAPESLNRNHTNDPQLTSLVGEHRNSTSSTTATRENGAIAVTTDKTASSSVSTATVPETKADEEEDVSAPPPHHVETRKEKRQRLKRHKQIAKQLKNRNARNLRRKVMHACFGLTFATLHHVLPKSTFVPGMAILSSATLIMELLRYRPGFGWMNAALHLVLGQSLRKHEMEGKFTGSFYFFTGVTLTSWLFDPTCATLGICQLALADPSASYFGRQTRHIYWSRIENGLGGFGRNKGFLGFLGGALFCFPFNYRVLRVATKHSSNVALASTSTPVLVAASFFLGIAGAFADLAVPTPAIVLPKKILGVRVPPFHIDDNMVVPLFSAYACQELFKYLHWTDLALSKWMVV